MWGRSDLHDSRLKSSVNGNTSHEGLVRGFYAIISALGHPWEMQLENLKKNPTRLYTQVVYKETE